jgi:hypothetical protein
VKSFISEDHYAELKAMGPSVAIPRDAAEINARNRVFHEEQEGKVSEWLQEESIGKFGLQILKLDQNSPPEIGRRKTFYQVMEESNSARAFFQPRIANETRSRFARSGGAARKRDPLRQRIDSLVAENPEISIKEVESRLRSEADEDVTCDFEFEDPKPLVSGDKPRLHYINSRGGRISKPVSCLRDYVCQAKSEMRASM